MELRFGTDGVRGVALTELTTDAVAQLGRAAAQVLGGGRWVIGRDPRASGPLLEAALAAGLHAGGARVELAGVVPTPAMALAGARWDVPTAMITASHNPYTDNGVKFFAPGGLKLRDETEARIEDAVEATPPTPEAGERGAASVPAASCDVAALYEDWMVERFPGTPLAGMHIVLDCANGAMSDIAPRVVARLGARTTVIHAAPDGRNINDRCGATHTDSLSTAVVDATADLGLAFDGDGDRVIAVDHLGRPVDGDRLLALSALHLHALGRLDHSAVAVTVMSNLGFHRAMAAAGIEVMTTAVGDRYVLEALDERGLALGGEQSGHIIYRRVATTGDGLLAGLRLAEYVAGAGRPLAQMADDVMTRFPQVLVNVPVAARRPDIADELAPEIARADERLGDDGRVLVRASGTEPLVRVMVESADDARAHEVATWLADVVRQRFA